MDVAALRQTIVQQHEAMMRQQQRGQHAAAAAPIAAVAAALSAASPSTRPTAAEGVEGEEEEEQEEVDSDVEYLPHRSRHVVNLVDDDADESWGHIDPTRTRAAGAPSSAAGERKRHWTEESEALAAGHEEVRGSNTVESGSNPNTADGGDEDGDDVDSDAEMERLRAARTPAQRAAMMQARVAGVGAWSGAGSRWSWQGGACGGAGAARESGVGTS
jgi:hypothetical protein